MRKLFAWFLLTVRWLLVPFLPALGLFVGWWFIPEARPAWERTLDEYVKCIGMQADGAKSYLLIYNQRRVKEGTQAYQTITCLDWTTGTELFRRKLPYDGFSKVQVVPNTTYALRWEFSNSDSLILYDCEHEVEYRQLNTGGARLSQITSPTLKNNVLTAVIGGPTLFTVACWHLRDGPKADAILITSESPLLRDLQLSSNGVWVVTSSQILSGAAGVPAEHRVELFDTKLGKKLQTLSSEIERIRWLKDTDGFMALHRDEKNAKQWWQKYIHKDGSFVPTGDAITLPRMGIAWNQISGTHDVVVSSNKDDAARNKVKGWLGKKQEWILERIWPETTILDIYRSSTGELVESLTIPDFGSPNVFEMADGTKTLLPTADGKGLVLQKGRQLTFWEFHPVSRWYPWIGLGLGVILSIFVARWNLRREARTKSTSPNP